MLSADRDAGGRAMRSCDRELLSVVMPARNEVESIPVVVTRLRNALVGAGIPHELVIVDDHSTDGTAALVDELIRNAPYLRRTSPERSGYAHAIRHGLRSAQGEIVCIMMADGADDPADAIAFYEWIEEGHDCVFGSRFVAGADISGYPVGKRILNRLGNRAVARLLNVAYDDFTNAFKMYRRRVIGGATLRSDTFAINLELSLLALRHSSRCVVLPNTWREREHGTSSFRPFRLAPSYLRVLFEAVMRGRSRHGRAVIHRPLKHTRA